MSVEIANVSDGLLTVKIAGHLKKSELVRAQASVAEMIRKYGKVQLLVFATDFLGWAREDDWSEMSSPASQDKHIEKIAIVGDKRWEDLALAFTGKGFRPVKIEYFVPADLAKARAWLGSTP